MPARIPLRCSLVLVVLVAVLQAGTGALAAPCDLGASEGSPPSEVHGYEYEAIWDVEAPAKNDVWAVVSHAPTGSHSGPRYTLWHFDGHEWGPRGTIDYGSDFSFSSPGDGWLVFPEYFPPIMARDPIPVVRRYDGRRWTSMVAAPSLLPRQVVALGPNDAWVAGSADDETAVEHWDGAAWDRTPLPSTRRRLQITDLAGASTNDVWAVGYVATGQYGTRERHARVLHWDGARWRFASVRIASGSGQTTLSGVVAFAADDVWAVGTRWEPWSARGAVVMHWDGAVWHAAPVPTFVYGLGALAGASDRSLLAVGGNHLARWDGARWLRVRRAEVNGAALLDVAVDPGGRAWVVGTRPAADGWAEATLAMRLCGV